MKTGAATMEDRDQLIARMAAAFAAARRLKDAIKTNRQARRGLEKQATYYTRRVAALSAEICGTTGPTRKPAAPDRDARRFAGA
jgi:hypothetical protein